jgi:hypothetical protein
VLITGKLAWAKKTTKDGEKSGLAVMTFGVEVLTHADTLTTSQSAVTDSASELHAASSEAPRAVPGHKARKLRLAKHLQQPWTPSGLVSEN